MGSGIGDRPSLSVLGCQIAVPVTETTAQRDAHVARTAVAVDAELKRTSADLVVLPELSSIDYSRRAFDRLAIIAETVGGPSTQIWQTIATRHKTTVVFGVPRKTETGYVISQVVVGPDGEIVGYYDKIHVAQYGASMEKEYFQRADRLLVFEVNGVRIAPIICYDIRVPELTRALCVKHRVDLVLHCGAYAQDLSYDSWHQFVVTRALENQVFVLSLNRAGDDFGSSVFCPPWVDRNTPVTAFGSEEEFRHLSIDLAAIDAARWSYPFLVDRLDDYDGLSVDSSGGA